VLELLVKNDIHIVIGPFDDSIAIVTEKLKIPYLSMTSSDNGRSLKSTFQVLPMLSDFSFAMFDLIKYYRWDKVSLFYDCTIRALCGLALSSMNIGLSANA
jgi:hypothetical protein